MVNTGSAENHGGRRSAGVLPRSGATTLAALLVFSVAAAAVGDAYADHPYENPPDSPHRTNIITRLPTMLWHYVRDTLTLAKHDRSHVLPHAETVAGLHALEGANTVTWIGHMTTLLKLDGRTILTDPWWANYASPVPGMGPRRYVPAALGLDELPPIDIVVVSHSHYDHLDLKAIASLAHRERITAVVPLGVGRYFRGLGYGSVVELGWHESTIVDDIAITALPAIHWSQRVPFKKNDTLWAAFSIESPSGARIYFGGDSDRDAAHLQPAHDTPGYDLALLSIGGFHNAGVHCAPEECAALGHDVGARVLVPMHWGTIYLGEGPPLDLPARFARAAVADGTAAEDVWVMRIGETRELPAPHDKTRVLRPLTVLDR